MNIFSEMTLRSDLSNILNTKMRIAVVVILSCHFVPCLPALRKPAKYGGSEARPIAYGGVMNEVSKVPANHSLIVEAAEFAIDWSLSRHPESIPKDRHGEVLSYTVSAPRILKLVYTDDDRSPYMYPTSYPSLHPSLQPLIWGYTFSFRVSWEHSGLSWTHIFMVTSHQMQLYVLQHTFHVAALTAPLTVPVVQPQLESVEAQQRTAMEIAADDFSSTDSCSRDTWLSNHWTSPALSTADKSTLQNVINKDSMTCETPQSDDEPCLSEAPHGEGADWSGASCQQSEALNVSFLCYNVWNTNTVLRKSGEYRKRMDRMIKLLHNSKADIIGLQEVRFQDGCCDDLGPNQMEHISAQLPRYQFVYRPGQIQSSELPRRVEEGVAMLSRYPVTRVRHHLLTRNSSDIADSHQRLLLHTEIDVPCFGLVHVLTTHLSLSHQARARSVREIWNYIQKLEGPVFLMGDFNAEIHNEEIKFLYGLHQLEGSSTRGLHDVWYMMHPLEQGFTFSTLEEQLSKRIDFLFLREDSRVSLAHVKLLDDGGRGSEAASDHLGLLATFILKPTESHSKH